MIDRSFSLVIAGWRVDCRIRGEGPPVLLAHGIPGDLRTLGPVAEIIAATHSAITVSLPVPEPSERPERPFGTAGLRDDLVDLILGFDLGPVNLVAWSYSAHSAMAVAAHRPELVSSLILYEPGFPDIIQDAAVRQSALEDTQAAFGPVAEALAAGEPELAIRRAIDGAAGTVGWFERQTAQVREVHLDTAHMLGRLFVQTPPIALGRLELRGIRCPTTVAWGGATRVCYRLVSEAAGRQIKGARTIIIPGATHLFPEQAPEGFAALLRSQLA